MSVSPPASQKIKFLWGALTLVCGIGLGWGLHYTFNSSSFIDSTRTMGKIQVCFSPHGQCLEQILAQIKRAEESIKVQGYSFTSLPIAMALIEAKEKGIKVEIILDKSQKRAPHSQFNRFLNEGMALWVDHKPAIQHNKVMIIDGKTLLTGSYNWTNAAEHRNAENLLMIEDNPALLQHYTQNFNKRRSLSQRIKKMRGHY